MWQMPCDTVIRGLNVIVDLVGEMGQVYLLVPFLWVMKYKPTHVFELQPMVPGSYPPPPR